MLSVDTYQEMIREIVSAIKPFDTAEEEHQKTILEWIDSGEPLCRINKPATPPMHLVSYFTLYDPIQERILLVDHKKAGLWLPPGGHVEPDELPKNAAHRELKEELGLELKLFSEDPLFVTVTETTEEPPKHTDVSLWYVYLWDSTIELSYDTSEFHAVHWFPMSELPTNRADPNLERFCQKLRHRDA
jgi:8-oxo-dGTP diphosphatase